MRLPRRPAPAFALAAAVTAGALLLAACGGGDSAGSTPSVSPAPTTSAGVEAAAFPVTIPHVYGSTTVPSQPLRVLTLGLSDQDPLLALGVKPIAVYPWYGDYPSQTWPWAQDELGDTKPVVLAKGVRNEAAPPIEEIASLEPDLILSLYNGTTRTQYEQLSRIAPTVLPTAEFDDFSITWQEATRITGLAVGRPQQATDLVRDLEGQFAAAAAAHPEFAGKRAIVAERFETGESVVRAGNDTRAKFFDSLGFELPTEVAGARPDQFGEITVSDELLPALSRDLLVWNIGFDDSLRATIEGLPLYRTLPVVQQGKVLYVDDPVVSGAFAWGTVLSLDFALEQLLPQITDAVAGRSTPSTASASTPAPAAG